MLIFPCTYGYNIASYIYQPSYNVYGYVAMSLDDIDEVCINMLYHCSFKVDGHDPAACQKACCADPKCLAWTFADPQPLLVSIASYTVHAN